MKNYIARTVNGGFMCFGLIDSFVKSTVDTKDAYAFLITQYGRTELPIVGSVLTGKIVWDNMSERQRDLYLCKLRDDITESLKEEIEAIGVATWKDWVIIPIED